jgi:hypothetical protein
VSLPDDIVTSGANLRYRGSYRGPSYAGVPV